MTCDCQKRLLCSLSARDKVFKWLKWLQMRHKARIQNAPYVTYTPKLSTSSAELTASGAAWGCSFAGVKKADESSLSHDFRFCIRLLLEGTKIFIHTEDSFLISSFGWLVGDTLTRFCVKTLGFPFRNGSIYPH